MQASDTKTNCTGSFDILSESFNYSPGCYLSYKEYKLIPDKWGSYKNGHWQQVAGGEAFGVPLQFVWTSNVAIYDPIKNTWTAINPPTFFQQSPVYGPAPNPTGLTISEVLAIAPGYLTEVNLYKPDPHIVHLGILL